MRTHSPTPSDSDAPPPRPLMVHPQAWITRRYVLALMAVAVLTVANFVAFQALVQAHERTLAVVNIGGRQRMLSQRIDLYVERLANHRCLADRAACVSALNDAVNLFELSHNGLTLGSEVLDIPGPTSQRVSDLYFLGAPSLDMRVRRYIAAARDILQSAPGDLTPLHPAVLLIAEEASGNLLEALDTMVHEYQTDGERALTTVRLLEVAMVVLTLLTLIIEARLIFQPMARRLEKQFDEIRTINTGLEQRIAERTRDLDTARAEAEQANRAKTRLLAAAGHDMLQPLQAAEMFTGMLARHPLEPQSLTLVRDLKRTQSTLRHLVQSVLDAARLEAGTITPSPQPVAVSTLFGVLLAEFGPVATEKELRLNAVNTSLCVHSDPQLMLRILRNLVSNALRYTTSGGVVIGAQRKGSLVVLRVVDSGLGIAPEDRDRIFEEFVQVGSHRRDRSEGLGLGLTIVHRLCSLLGHGIALRSVPGRGTSFSILCAPAKQPEQDAFL